MKYNQAKELALKENKKLTREAWGNRGKFIFSIPAFEGVKRIRKLMICDNSKKLKDEPQITEFNPGGDSHAHDWMVVA